ncbi:MAG: hypothetical protein IT365_23575 [Candidatus Hydrogenedentes bacterium]|nr:hypothetical protein [Candidatus Hydrogenedentota bacterium]
MKKHRAVLVAVLGLLISIPVFAEPVSRITLDGSFTDWQYVPSYTDPVDDQHDTDHDLPGDTPAYVDHEDVDLIECKFTHDENNLYAYFKSTGVIGRTQSHTVGTAGRFYVIVTIDVDNDDATGYPLHEGGYYPTTPGYDMNMEVEFYDAAFNTGHYLNHGCLDENEYDQAQIDQANGIVDVKAGTYDWYTQWVWWDTPQGNPGEITLPDGHSTIIWVADKGPVYQGIIEIALSPDGHEAEMKAPFRGFMKYPDYTTPIMALGYTIDASFSLEASGELAVGALWASDTADPINGYYLALPTEDSDGDGLPDGWEADNVLNPNDDGSTDPDQGANGDPDNDTFTNEQEYAYSTDPRDSGSTPPVGVPVVTVPVFSQKPLR